jgi:hypothetical protein
LINYGICTAEEFDRTLYEHKEDDEFFWDNENYLTESEQSYYDKSMTG